MARPIGDSLSQGTALIRGQLGQQDRVEMEVRVSVWRSKKATVRFQHLASQRERTTRHNPLDFAPINANIHPLSIKESISNAHDSQGGLSLLVVARVPRHAVHPQLPRQIHKPEDGLLPVAVEFSVGADISLVVGGKLEAVDVYRCLT